jgi:hypothetical protein
LERQLHRCTDPLPLRWMGKSAEVIDGKGVASLPLGTSVRNWLKIKVIDPRSVCMLEGSKVGKLREAHISRSLSNLASQ